MTTRFLYFIYTITIRVEGLINKGWKYRRGIKMDNVEKLVTLGTQDRRRRQEKQNTQHNMCWTTLYAYKHK